MSELCDEKLEARVRELLEVLLPTHAPSGHEQEMDRACWPYLKAVAEQVWQDAQGNLIAQLCGGDGPSLGIFAHKDEIAVMVSRIHDDGKMELEPLGGSYPWSFGEGPWEVLGDEPVLGVLGVGSRHVSALSREIHEAKHSKPLTWPAVRLDCKLSPKELAERGVTVGSPACVARSRKTPVYLGDYVGGYALDDKAGVAAGLIAAELLRERLPEGPSIYLVLTGMEEIGTVGALRVPHGLELDAVLAIETIPVAPEYPVEPGPVPAVLFKDAVSIYSPRLSRFLAATAEKLLGQVQRAVVRSYGSDATGMLSKGLASRVALVGFPTENTHGYEVAHLGAIANCGRVAAEFARLFTEGLTQEG
ncbi:MAG: M20/M25/M40 family metallo-hydrolase [Armatimonadetes bacterium]|nr:M20/M25/M40 family metallo-hydrolase [Armatimonadota bacterium]